MDNVRQIITLVKSFVWCWRCGDKQDFEMRADRKWHCQKCGEEWKSHA